MKSKTASAFTIFGLCFFLLGFLARYHWFLELFANFRVYFLFYFLGMFFISIWTKHKWMAGLNLALSLWILLSIKPYFEKQSYTNSGDSLKLMSANVLSSNSEHRSLIDLIQEENPDVIFLMEVTSGWVGELEILKKNYPYFMAIARL